MSKTVAYKYKYNKTQDQARIIYEIRKFILFFSIWFQELFFNWHLSDTPDGSDSLSNGQRFLYWHGHDRLAKSICTVDHDILLQKLKALGFDPLAIKWFESYLKGRNKKTEINGIFSDPRVVPCRVPQGSILGPLLFLLYINDMEAAVSCQLILYADDSALLVSGKDVNKIEQQLGNELSSLNGWLVDNRLSIHLGKTESILFGTKKRLGISSEMNVTCGETMAASTKSVRYLGVDLDQSLDGNYIAENILKKGNSRLKFLWRHAKFLNTNSKKLLTSALIQCHFDYAWFSGLQKIYQQKLQILQNKICPDLLPKDAYWFQWIQNYQLNTCFRTR